MQSPRMFIGVLLISVLSFHSPLLAKRTTGLVTTVDKVGSKFELTSTNGAVSKQVPSVWIVYDFIFYWSN